VAQECLVRETIYIHMYIRLHTHIYICLDIQDINSCDTLYSYHTTYHSLYIESLYIRTYTRLNTQDTKRRIRSVDIESHK